MCLRADPDLANAFMQKAEDEGGQIDVSNGKNQVYKWLRKAVRCATPRRAARTEPSRVARRRARAVATSTRLRGPARQDDAVLRGGRKRTRTVFLPFAPLPLQEVVLLLRRL